MNEELLVIHLEEAHRSSFSGITSPASTKTSFETAIYRSEAATYRSTCLRNRSRS